MPLLDQLTPILTTADAQLAAYATQLAQLNAQSAQLQKAAADAIAALAKAQSQIKKFVLPGSNLSQLLTQANPGQAFVIDSAFNVPPTTITKPNVSLICLPGASLNFQPIGSTGIEVAAPGFAVSGPTLTGPSVNGKPYTVAFHLKYGAIDFCLSDVSAADGQLAKLVEIDAGADRAQIVKANVGMISGCGIFCSADDLLVAYLNASGSTDEHVIRFDQGIMPDKTMHRPQRGTVIGGTMGNTDGKEVIACREIDFITIAGITIPRGWLGFGQSGNDTNIHCSHARLSSIGFAQNARPGGQLIDIQHDVDVVASDVTAYGYSDVPAFIVNDRAKLMLQSCIQRIPAGVDPKTVKPLAKGSGTIVGLETVTQVAA